MGRGRGCSSVVAPHLRDRFWSDRRHVVGPTETSLVASGPLTCRLSRADQQDCPAPSVKRPGGHQELAGGCSRDSTRGIADALQGRSRTTPAGPHPPPSPRHRLQGEQNRPAGPTHAVSTRTGEVACGIKGRGAGGTGSRLGGSLLRREMSWVFRRRPDRRQRLAPVRLQPRSGSDRPAHQTG